MCPIYEPYRHILREVSRDVALPDVLGTTEGIEALTEFITRSGAFTVTGRPREERQDPEYEPFDWFTHWNTGIGEEWERQAELEEANWTEEWREGEENREEEEEE